MRLEFERYTSEVQIGVSSSDSGFSNWKNEKISFPDLYSECRLSILLSTTLHPLSLFHLMICLHHRSTAHSPSLVVPSTITRLATVTRFNSSESTQANSLFLAPHAKIFPRTAIPHVLFYRDYHPTPIFIIGFVGQSMLDQLISIGELRQQVVLDPIAEGFQVI